MATRAEAGGEDATDPEAVLPERIIDLPAWSNGDPFPVADFVETLWFMVSQEVAHSLESD
jgi:hypothetical protein